MGDSNESNFETILTLSTANMPSTNPTFGDVRVQSHEYCYIGFVGSVSPISPEELVVEAWFKPILHEARKRGCSLILFDSEGSYFDGLETWDW